jgi:hypothetical protein
MQSPVVRTLLVLLTLPAVAPLPATYAQSTGAATDASASITPAKPSGLGKLDVAIVTSRAQATVGSDIGVVGILTNRGDSVVYISESSVVLALPPELVDPAYASTIESWFPTEHNSSDTIPRNTKDIVVALQPAVSYPVFFRFGRYQSRPQGDKRPTWLGWVKGQLGAFGFTPGKYQISVVAKSWVDSAGAPLHPRRYVTQTQSAMVDVAAPQYVVMTGAAIGGLLAYLLFPSRRRREEEKSQKVDTEGNLFKRTWVVTMRVRKALWSAVLAMLWSAIVTILLARLSDTQFVVRVTIQDFWGAIALGFVAQYAGAKWLEKYDTAGRSTDLPPEGHAPAT